MALWLRSARKDEKVLDLRNNVIAADSLDLPATFSRLGKPPGSFDLVVGNPPWGGDLDPAVCQQALAYLGLPEGSTWDSWELFLLLAIRALREGGRLALVLPDSFLYPQKARIRNLLLQNTSVEKVHNLGPDWFGSDVRMGTVVIQARRGPADMDGTVRCMVLAGGLRGQAIRGEIPLTQIESQRSRLVPVARIINSETHEVEVFRGVEDDRIIAQMVGHSVTMGELCERARGEEINKAGLIWIRRVASARPRRGKRRRADAIMIRNARSAATPCPLPR